MAQNTAAFSKKDRTCFTLKKMLENSKILYGQNPAFLVKQDKSQGYTEITYNKFFEDMNFLGTSLLHIGLKDKHIAIIGANSYQWIISYFSTVNGTGVVVPLDKELTREEIINLIHEGQCEAVFYDESFREIINEIDIKHKILLSGKEKKPGELLIDELILQGKELVENGDMSFIDAEIDPDIMHMLLFTSGTTGKAKGVMLSHRNVMTNIMDINDYVKVYETDRTLSVLPIHHTFESTILSTLLYNGASAAFCEGLKHVAKNMSEAQATIFVGVPLLFESIYNKVWKEAEKTGKTKALKALINTNKKLKAIGIDLNKQMFSSIHKSLGGKLRILISGASGIDPAICRGFEDLGFQFIQGYGLTECSPLISGTKETTNTYKKAGSVGHVVAHGEVKVIDSDENGIGEILFRGDNLMLGYFQDEEQTNEVIKNGWFHTGDLGFIEHDGWIYITGRRKNLIVTKTGKNIYPEELEEYINSVKYIEESLVYGKETESSESSDSTVCVKVKPDYEAISADFGAYYGEDEIYLLIKKEIGEINGKLPVYKRIRNILISKENFVKTTTKKIKRQDNI